ncbi:TVP38/TMEM64 family protein [Dokdonella immobilis]|uniref:TVP38/TMEM64 family membrane protein n=1 Tax=Dokdonella immobilis TaxID=578942 RepID=A0A1I4W8F6_9GAMM|nr:VTT domain-containing protein [Dokdonella immobilis]SFN09687.1 Uncharacterized membrane protein YdjX, TVP38/TMEM64 family, SNARE-associated domain [Dokdonella immobilis]
MNPGDQGPPPPGPHARRLLRRELRSILAPALVVVLVIIVLAVVGHEAELHLQAIEDGIAALGPWGRLAFVGVLVLGTSALLPESVFGLAAGALFGLAWGFGLTLLGNILAAALQYGLAGWLLHDPIQDALQRRPLLRALQGAVVREGMRLQVLLRLTPLNPALISYLLGAAGVRFGGFVLASLVLGLHSIIEVWLGHAGKQLVARGLSGTADPWQHNLPMLAGAIIGMVAIVLVSKAAHRAVLRSLGEARESTSDGR